MKKINENKKRKIATTSMAILGVTFVIGGAFAALNDTLTNEQSVTIEWVDIVDNSASTIALEDVNDATNTPVTELTPGVTYELTGTLENDSSVTTEWSATDLTAVPGMTVTINDMDGADTPAAIGEDIDVSQFGITVAVDQNVAPSTDLNFSIRFDAVDARDYVAPPTATISEIFPDPALAACVANDVESGANGDVNYEITQAKLDTITSIDCQSMGIVDLEGMQYLTNLTYLKLDSNEIVDLSPLANLEYLNHLNLFSNNVSDLTPLTNLTSLTYIDLGYNAITDISPIANLTNVNELYLNNNQITDYSVLNYQPEIFWAGEQAPIALPQTVLGTATPIALDGINGEDLIITWTTPGTYVDGMLTWTNPGANSLTYATADGSVSGTVTQNVLATTLTQPTAISTIFPDPALAQCVASDSQSGANGNVNYVISQAELNNITKLTCNSKGVVSIEGVQYLHNIIELQLNYNEISDITPLTNLMSLEELWIGSNNITDVNSLKNLPNLDNIFMDNNQITDLSVLNNVSNYYAPQQYAILPDTTLGAANPVIIDGIDSQNMTIELVTPGKYENGELTWYSPGINMLIFENGVNIDGVVVQYVAPAKTITAPTAINEIFLDPAMAACVANDDESGANGNVDYVISQTTLKNMTSLDCANQGIMSIEGIQYMTGLTELNLDNNKISDFSALKYQPTNFSALNQDIDLPTLMYGAVSSAITIDGINGEDFILTFQDPGTYVDGILTWSIRGNNNSLIFTNNDGTITGTVSQYTEYSSIPPYTN